MLPAPLPRPRERSWGSGLLLLVLLVLVTACSMVPPAPAPLGTEQNPVKLALSPATDTQKAIAAIEPLTRLLTAETGLRFKLTVPTSHDAVIEAMATNNIDIGWLAPLAYVVAHDRVGAEPLLVSVRHGGTMSSGQIVVRADSGIVSLEALRGRRLAFVDNASATGSVMPRALLASQGIDLESFLVGAVFVGDSESVLHAVVTRRVDGGVLTDPAPTEPLRVVARTAPVPNDALSLRKGIPPALGQKIADGLQHVAASPAGARVLHDLDGVEGLAPVTDGAFDSVRSAARLLALDMDAALAPRPTTPTR